MNPLKYWLIPFLLFSCSVANAQMKNVKTSTVKIYGNCDACKIAIEKAGNIKKTAYVRWEQNMQTAVLSYNTKKTNQSEILKRIALAGFDSDEFLAPDEAYAKLPACCQYERVYKPKVKAKMPMMKMPDEEHSMPTNEPEPVAVMDTAKMETILPKNTEPSTVVVAATETPKMEMPTHEHIKQAPVIKTTMEMPETTKPAPKQPSSTTRTPAKPVVKPASPPPTAPVKKEDANQLLAVFDAYFAVKDALVKTEGATAAAKAKDLQNAINEVKMGALKMDAHIVWMNVMKPLAVAAKNIADAKDIAQQRKYFIALSKNIYDLKKVAPTDTPAYYQYCPMANDGEGANWLSKEKAVKNPYYGSQMLSCGRTVETIN